MAVLVFTVAGAAAEIVTPNHLDCRFDEGAQSLICPQVLPTGRAAAEPVAATAGAGTGEPAQGSPEWNAACTAKYKSFDPATGSYTSFSGKTKPCRL
jgi:hypothetical protein